MTGRAHVVARAVLFAVLSLALPAGVRAQPTETEVTRVDALAQVRVDDVGLGADTVTVSRIILTPGTGDTAVRLPGPRFVLVEAGELTFQASGSLRVVRAKVEPVPGATPAATIAPTPTPTPNPLTTPTTEALLTPGDAVPVPIWTMHSLRNAGTVPAVILDIRIGAGTDPQLPDHLDVAILAQETGLTTLPEGRGGLVIGRGTIASGGLVLAPQPDTTQLVAAVGGGGRADRAADGSVRNAGAEAFDAYVVTITAMGAAGPRPPLQPATGPGGAEVAFDRVVETRYEPEIQGYTLVEPADPHPGTTVATTGPFPVVLFLGGCCANYDDDGVANDPSDVREWMEHLVQRGAIVIYPHTRGGDAGREDILVAMRSAVAELGNGAHAAPDWSRFAVFGYSYGGWNAPLYAATAAAAGLPVPRAVFSAVSYDPATTPDLSAIPAETRVIVLVDDDTYGWYDHGARRIWAALGSVPAENRAYVHLVDDNHGIVSLRANHQLAATGAYGVLDALDWYGTWKLGDALLSCTFAGQECASAFGDTPEQRFMGYWSDGVPVAEIEVIAEPGPPDPATPEAAG